MQQGKSNSPSLEQRSKGRIAGEINHSSTAAILEAHKFQ